MTDYTELKRLAEALIELNKANLLDWAATIEDARIGKTHTEYALAANPAAVLAVIAENERLAAGALEGSRLRTELLEQFNQITAENSDYKAGQERYEELCESQRNEIRSLKTEIKALHQALQSIAAQVDGNIRPTVRDCINGQNNVQDIYGYCDQIESIAAAAMKEPQP